MGLAILAFCAGRVSAQTTDWRAFDRELRATTDTQRLDALLAARVVPAEGDANVAFERGLVLLRRWEITRRDPDRERAAEAFERVRELVPDDPRGHWGGGLVLAYEAGLRDGRLAVTGRSWASMFGLDARGRARRSLERALVLDPSFDRAAATLGELALGERDTLLLWQMFGVLAPVLARTDADEVSLSALVRVADAVGEHDTALRAGARLAARPEATARDVHSYALALLRTPGREAEGANLYGTVTRRGPPALLERIWTEIGMIASPAEREAWAAADTDERRRILEGFWDVRAGLGAVSVPERLAEHYRRLTVALTRYRRTTEGPMLPWAINQHWPEAPVDERGVVYLRHGPPAEIVRTPPILGPGSSMCARLVGATETVRPGRGAWAPPAPPMGASADNETWVYRDEDGGARLMNFLRCPGSMDFAIPYDVPCGDEWLEDRKRLDLDLRLCGWQTPERFRVASRRTFATDSDAPDFTSNLPMGYDLVAFRGEGGRTDLSALIAIMADSLVADTLADGRRVIALDLSLFVVDTVAGSVERADTTWVYGLDAEADRSGVLVAHVNITTDARADAVQRLRVQHRRRPERGGVLGQHIRIPSFTGDSLMLSTIVLGVPGEGGNWQRGATRLTIMPTGEFTGGDFRAFYEVYNLPEGTRYQTELELERDRDAAGLPVGAAERAASRLELRFTDVALPENGVVQELRSIDTQLVPGRYRIRVRVTNLETNAAATTERWFSVTPDEAGR